MVATGSVPSQRQRFAFGRGSNSVMKKVFEIDGRDFHDLEGFYAVMGNALRLDSEWGNNLDAFNDILRGGFGTPETGFVIRWRNSEISRQALGYPETLKWLKNKLRTCHPDSRDSVEREITRAENQMGPTLFDILVDIIEMHRPTAEGSHYGVELELA